MTTQSLTPAQNVLFKGRIKHTKRAKRRREKELSLIQEFIRQHGVTVLPPAGSDSGYCRCAEGVE